MEVILASAVQPGNAAAYSLAVAYGTIFATLILAAAFVIEPKDAKKKAARKCAPAFFGTFGGGCVNVRRRSHKCDEPFAPRTAMFEDILGGHALHQVNNYCEHGDDAYSYNTCIRTALPDGTFVHNVTKYSRTSSKHQTKARGLLRGITVENVPKGATAEVLRELARVKPLNTLRQVQGRRGWHKHFKAINAAIKQEGITIDARAAYVTPDFVRVSREVAQSMKTSITVIGDPGYKPYSETDKAGVK